MAMMKTPSISIDTRTGIVRAGDLELDAATLVAIAKPEARVLWAFVRASDGDTVRAVPFDESRVIWLEDTDLRYPEAAKEHRDR